jgi:replication factor A1
MKLPRMTLDEIVNKVVEEKGLSRKQVFDLIEKKKENLSWMISDEGAADIVAKELGVETYPDSDDEDLSLTIADLVAGMSNVMITGRATMIKPVKEFIDKNGGKGIVANITITDKSGNIRVVLWGEAAKPIQDSNVGEGNIVRIHNGYVREDLTGRTELHVGRRGHIEVNPADIREQNLPDNQKKFMEIRDLTADMDEVNVTGVVNTVCTTRILKTEEGREAKTSSLIIADKTNANARVVFLNDKIPLMENIRKGDVVEILSGRVRINRNRETELHVDSTTTFNVNQTHAGIDRKIGEVTHSIIEAKRELSSFSTEGVITEQPHFKEFARADGATGKILSFVISDDSSSIRVVAWGEHAEKLRDLKKGYTVRIADAKLRNGMKGELEIHIRNADTVEIKTKKDAATIETETLKCDFVPPEKKSQMPPRRRISELRDGENVAIRGIITKVNSKNPVYMACPKCLRKVDSKNGEWLCSKDGNILKPTMRVLYNLILDDGTGTITCTLSGRPGEELLDMELTDMVSGSEVESRRNQFNLPDLLGMDIVFVGRCYLNQKLTKRDFKVTTIIKPDPKAEAKILLEHIKNDFAC